MELRPENVGLQIATAFARRDRRLRKQLLGPPILTNLVGWYTALVPSSISLSGSDITAWADQSGNAYNLAPTHGAGDRPTYSARTLNGVVVPEFDGAKHGLYTTNILRSDLSQTTYVCGELDTVADRALVSSYNEFNLGLWVRSDAGTARLTEVKTGGVPSNQAQNGSIGISTGSPFVASERLETTQVTLRVNGTPETDVVSISGIGTNEQYMVVGHGHFYRGHAPYDGSIAELLVYNGVHTDGEMAYMESWLAGRWGVTW